MRSHKTCLILDKNLLYHRHQPIIYITNIRYDGTFNKKITLIFFDKMLQGSFITLHATVCLKIDKIVPTECSEYPVHSNQKKHKKLGGALMEPNH